jgi:thiosulfate dehydrogenase
MKSFLAGVVIGMLIIPGIAFFYVRGGHMPVATADPPFPFEKIIAQKGLHSRLDREAPQRDVSGFTAADLAAGAEVYRMSCAFCHGLPQQPAPPAARGMFPDPPQLFTPKDMVTDDPAGVTYWKVKNGIRLTGMPAFHDSLRDQQIWQVSALLTRADKLPPEVLDALKPPAGSGAANPGSSAAPPQH